jgi:hypothetical protein
MEDRAGARDTGCRSCVIAYYERDDAQPPGAVLVHLAQALASRRTSCSA